MRKHRVGFFALLMVLFWFAAGLWALVTITILLEMWTIGFFAGAVVIESVLVCGAIVCGKKAPKLTNQEAAKLRAQAREELSQLREDMRKARAQEAERKRLDNLPVAATLLYVKTESGKRILGTAARALIGTALLGMTGTMIGVATGRQISDARMATFAVKYASGRKGNETVDVKSNRFKELSAVLLD